MCSGNGRGDSNSSSNSSGGGICRIQAGISRARGDRQHYGQVDGMSRVPLHWNKATSSS